MLEQDVINQKNEAERKRIRQAYYRLFNTDDGKIVLDNLRKFCGYDATSVCEQAPDALQTMYSEGKRRVYLRILSMKEEE